MAPSSLFLALSLIAVCTALWPQPSNSRSLGGSPLPICVGNLVFSSNSSSKVLNAAFARYEKLIFSLSSSPSCNGERPVTVPVYITVSPLLHRIPANNAPRCDCSSDITGLHWGQAQLPNR
jgi:hypothetical protein